MTFTAARSVPLAASFGSGGREREKERGGDCIGLRSQEQISRYSTVVE